MEEKLSGIVLSSISYGENDKILNIFTLEKGIVSARIKGVKKAGAKLKFASEPFCFCEYIFSLTGDKRLVINASLIDSFYSIREDIVKYYAGGTALEFTKKFAKEEIVSPDMFMLLINTLKDISYKQGNPKIFVIRFLISALKIVGYELFIKHCKKCGGDIIGRTFFNYTDGSFFCENCFEGEGREINNETYQTIKNIEKFSDFNEENLNKALKLLDFYILNKIDEKISSIKELIAL